MSYANQQMSGNRITALIIVALIHIALGYALITGLAYSAIQQVVKKVTTVDIKKDEPKPPPPPPPPKNMPPPPPIVAPPVKLNIAPNPPPVVTVAVAPPPAPPAPVFAPPAPPAPPAPRFSPKGPRPKGDASTWVTTDDYPSRALREMRAGRTSVRMSVGSDGRVTGCDITTSSGSPDLDAASCSYLTRRARFAPATDGDGNATAGVFPKTVVWVIPKE